MDWAERQTFAELTDIMYEMLPQKSKKEKLTAKNVGQFIKPRKP